MSLLSIVKRVINKKSPDQAAIEYAYQKGFKSGKNFLFNSGFPIDGNYPWLIEVGDNVTLATGVKLLAHDASTAKIPGVRTKIGRVTIGDNVFIGTNSIVLPNITIGSNVVIGSGSVVTKDIPDNSIYAGNPARFICTYDEYCKKHQENQDTHPIFREHLWKEWPEVSEEEKQLMKDKLSGIFGYL